MDNFWINNNGKKEKLGEMKSGIHREQVDKKFQNLFDAFDKDKSGTLDIDELKEISNKFQIFAGKDNILDTTENNKATSIFSEQLHIENADFMGFVKSVSDASTKMIVTNSNSIPQSDNQTTTQVELISLRFLDDGRIEEIQKINNQIVKVINDLKLKKKEVYIYETNNVQDVINTNAKPVLKQIYTGNNQSCVTYILDENGKEHTIEELKEEAIKYINQAKNTTNLRCDFEQDIPTMLAEDSQGIYNWKTIDGKLSLMEKDSEGGEWIRAIILPGTTRTLRIFTNKEHTSGWEYNIDNTKSPVFLKKFTTVGSETIGVSDTITSRTVSTFQGNGKPYIKRTDTYDKATNKLIKSESWSFDENNKNTYYYSQDFKTGVTFNCPGGNAYIGWEYSSSDDTKLRTHLYKRDVEGNIISDKVLDSNGNYREDLSYTKSVELVSQIGQANLQFDNTKTWEEQYTDLEEQLYNDLATIYPYGAENHYIYCYFTAFKKEKQLEIAQFIENNNIVDPNVFKVGLKNKLGLYIPDKPKELTEEDQSKNDQIMMIDAAIEELKNNLDALDMHDQDLNDNYITNAFEWGGTALARCGVGLVNVFGADIGNKNSSGFAQACTVTIATKKKWVQEQIEELEALKKKVGTKGVNIEKEYSKILQGDKAQIHKEYFSEYKEKCSRAQLMLDNVMSKTKYAKEYAEAKSTNDYERAAQIIKKAFSNTNSAEFNNLKKTKEFQIYTNYLSNEVSPVREKLTGGAGVSVKDFTDTRVATGMVAETIFMIAITWWAGGSVGALSGMGAAASSAAVMGGYTAVRQGLCFIEDIDNWLDGSKTVLGSLVGEKNAQSLRNYFNNDGEINLSYDDFRMSKGGRVIIDTIESAAMGYVMGATMKPIATNANKVAESFVESKVFTKVLNTFEDKLLLPATKLTSWSAYTVSGITSLTQNILVFAGTGLSTKIIEDILSESSRPKLANAFKKGPEAFIEYIADELKKQGISFFMIQAICMLMRGLLIPKILMKGNSNTPTALVDEYYQLYTKKSNGKLSTKEENRLKTLEQKIKDTAKEIFTPSQLQNWKDQSNLVKFYENKINNIVKNSKKTGANQEIIEKELKDIEATLNNDNRISDLPQETISALKNKLKFASKTHPYLAELENCSFDFQVKEMRQRWLSELKGLDDESREYLYEYSADVEAQLNKRFEHLTDNGITVKRSNRDDSVEISDATHKIVCGATGLTLTFFDSDGEVYTKTIEYKEITKRLGYPEEEIIDPTKVAEIIADRFNYALNFYTEKSAKTSASKSTNIVSTAYNTVFSGLIENIPKGNNVETPIQVQQRLLEELKTAKSDDFIRIEKEINNLPIEYRARLNVEFYNARMNYCNNTKLEYDDLLTQYYKKKVAGVEKYNRTVNFVNNWKDAYGIKDSNGIFRNAINELVKPNGQLDKYLKAIMPNANTETYSEARELLIKYLECNLDIYTIPRIQSILETFSKTIEKMGENTILYVPDQTKSYGLIAAMYKRINPNIKIIVGYNNLKFYTKQIPNLKVILIDDCIGSGDSAVKTYNGIKEACPNIQSVDLFVCTAFQKGLNIIKQEASGLNVHYDGQPRLTLEESDFYKSLIMVIDGKENNVKQRFLKEILKYNDSPKEYRTGSALMFPYMAPNNNTVFSANMIEGLFSGPNVAIKNIEKSLTNGKGELKWPPDWLKNILN